MLEDIAGCVVNQRLTVDTFQAVTLRRNGAHLGVADGIGCQVRGGALSAVAYRIKDIIIFGVSRLFLSHPVQHVVLIYEAAE